MKMKTIFIPSVAENGGGRFLLVQALLLFFFFLKKKNIVTQYSARKNKRGWVSLLLRVTL